MKCLIYSRTDSKLKPKLKLSHIIIIEKHFLEVKETTCAAFHAVASYIPSPQADPMIVSSSNIFGPKCAWWSVAICFIPKNTCSQGTDHAWAGRTSSATHASVGYS